MKDFCVIGSGIAGSVIANLLSKKYSVEIFDKARGPGGRASNRRYKDNQSFDHGLQYISPKSSEFEKFILNLKKKQVVKEWLGNHIDFTLQKKKSIKYIGSKGNNDICKYLIKKIKANYLSEVTKIEFRANFWVVTLNDKKEVYFKKIILTCPFPQFKKLSYMYLDKKILNLDPKMIPNITVMVAYKNYKQIPVSTIKFDDQIIGWAANENTKKRFKSKLSFWTLQASEKYSKSIINLYKNNKKKYELEILKNFENLIGFKSNKVVTANIHGWKYAYSSQPSANLKSLWISDLNLGVCGDWLLGSKAEDAWFSANSLYKEIKKNPLI